MIVRFWHWDDDEMAIVSDQGDYLSIEEFIAYTNGLERGVGYRSSATLDLPGVDEATDRSPLAL